MFAMAWKLFSLAALLLFTLLKQTVICHILQQSEETLRINLKTGKVLGFSEYIHFEEIVSNNEIWNQSSLYSGKKGRGRVEFPTATHRKSCSMQALLRIDLSGPFSALKFHLFFNRPKLWTFHVSQSPRDFGFGKILTNTHSPTAIPTSASLQIHNRQLSMYGALVNDAPSIDPAIFGSPPTPVLLAVRDDAMPRRSRSSLSVTLEHKSLKWDLKPESWTKTMSTTATTSTSSTLKNGAGGGEDEIAASNNWQLQSEQLFDFHSHNASYLYIGLNRAVGAVYKYGAGLCEVHIILQRAREKRDECTGGNHTCDFNAECIDTKNSFRCVCKPGFKGNGHYCHDENECDFLNGHCVQTCTNTQGGYFCSCYDGFKLADNKRDCLDLNECENDNGLCEHGCENTVGSYRCTCRDGYSLAADGYSCLINDDVYTSGYGDICAELGCAHGCHESHKLCYCKDGFRLHVDGKECVPTCEIGNGGCQHKCFDSEHGTICGCHPDYFLAMDNRTCIVSCAIDNGGCDRLCENTPLGVRCHCPTGYRLSKEDNKTCIDVDECQYGNGGCQFTCTNTYGSYECRCPEGYLLDNDQRSCLDIDECAFAETCQQECVNLPGSYECRCHSGYHSYAGRYCADIDECSNDNGGCQHSCVNIPGSYTCTCPTGYKLHYNGNDCQAVNCDKPSFVSGSLSPASVWFDQGAFVSCHVHRYSSFYLRPASKFVFQCSNDRCGQGNGNNGNIEIRTVVDTCDVEAVTERRNSRFVRDGSAACDDSHFSVCSLDVSCERVTIQGTTKAIFVLTLKAALLDDLTTGVSYPSQFRLHSFAENWRRAVTMGSVRFHHHGVTYTIKASTAAMKHACSQHPSSTIANLDSPFCFTCDPGTYLNMSFGFCIPCPVGTYQSEPDSLDCAPCPTTSYSMGIGAANVQQCGGFCNAGQYSQTGMVPCLECAIGFYQSNIGRASCKKCAGHLTTLNSGSKSFGDCSVKAHCTEGFFYDTQLVSCMACPIGTYQPKTDQNYCIKCPENMTTDQPGSISLEQCKHKHCQSRIGRLGGYLESANYPNEYPNNAMCTWVLRAPKGHRLLLFIPELQLAADRCRDYLVMRKNASPYSAITFEGCESSEQPLALIARSRRLWIQFRTDDQKTAKGFHLRYVAYQDQYHPLIEDIVRDSRLYTTPSYRSIFNNRRFLEAFIDVISEPNNYPKYLNISTSVFPRSFLDILWPKIHRFFDLADL